MSVESIDNYETGVRSCCFAGLPIRKAAERIVELDVNALAVVDLDGRVEGIVTDHDIIRSLVGGTFDSATVRDCMSSPAVSCEADTPLSEALRLMTKHRIRHLVMLRDGAFLRVFSQRDLLERIHADDALEAGVLRDLALLRMSPAD
ncbi:cyclic nucleotide-binding/CBS domain-containing protein [Tropicimonas sp. IMCC6043]|uniref:CBS domain-containing protein n=1 Tax=Tropicimonas sp. IMCC6043 TaxID=2510645 RepID=UPI0013EDD66D|nr:CBS domain-containing protein [Tropicimonas sp. IMCC6043]